MPRERRWHFQARQHGAERGPLADLRSPISEEADAGLRMRPGAVRQTRRSTRDLRSGRGDLRPGCVDPRHLRSLLAGPGGARYTTLVSKHSETSDATDSHPGDAARTPPMTSGPSLVLRDNRQQGTMDRIAHGVTEGGRSFVDHSCTCAADIHENLAAVASLCTA